MIGSGVGDDDVAASHAVCTSCGTINYNNEPACPLCEVPFDVDDLMEYINRRVTEHENDPDTVDPDDVEIMSVIAADIEGRFEDYMLCCGYSLDECSCSEVDQISFHQAHMYANQEQSLDAYDIAAACNDCVFMYTSKCKPYRRWLAKFWEVDDPEEWAKMNKELEGCEDFVSFEQADQTGAFYE